MTSKHPNRGWVRGHLTPDNRARLSTLPYCVALHWNMVDSAKTLLRRAYFALILYISQEMILGREQSFLCQLDSSYEYEYETILYTWKCGVKMKTNSSAWAAVTAQVTNLPPDLNASVCQLLSICQFFSINWFPHRLLLLFLAKLHISFPLFYFISELTSAEWSQMADIVTIAGQD